MTPTGSELVFRVRCNRWKSWNRLQNGIAGMRERRSRNGRRRASSPLSAAGSFKICGPQSCLDRSLEESAMKAFIVETADGPFREIEMATPVPATGQVLVKIHASGINPLDTKIRAGAASHAKQPLPAVLGLDMAGAVVETGPGVTAFRAGDEVFGMV